MGPIWGQQGPGEPHVGPMNFAIWVVIFMVSIIENNIGSGNGLFHGDISQAMTWTNANLMSVGYLEQNSVKYHSKYNGFHKQKCILLWRLRNGGHFAQIRVLEC